MEVQIITNAFHLTLLFQPAEIHCFFSKNPIYTVILQDQIMLFNLIAA